MFKKLAQLTLLATAALSALPILPASAAVFRDGMDILLLTFRTWNATRRVYVPESGAESDRQQLRCGAVLLLPKLGI